MSFLKNYIFIFIDLRNAVATILRYGQRQCRRRLCWDWENSSWVPEGPGSVRCFLATLWDTFLAYAYTKNRIFFLKKFLFFHNFQNPTHISNVKDRRRCVFVRYICIYSNITTYIRMCYIHHFVFIYPRLFGIHTRFTYRETNNDNTNNRRALLWIPVQTTPHLKRGGYPTQHNPNLYERTSVCPTLSDR